MKKYRRAKGKNKRQKEAYYKPTPFAIDMSATARKISGDQELLSEFQEERKAVIELRNRVQSFLGNIQKPTEKQIQSAYAACGMTNEAVVKVGYFIMLDMLMGGNPEDWCLSAEELPDKKRGEER